MVMDLKTNMEILGKRLPYLVKYKAGMDENNKLMGVDMKMKMCTVHNGVGCIDQTFTSEMLLLAEYLEEIKRI